MFLLQKGFDWRFNPPGASHFGGIWERQKRSIRKILAGLCDEQRLTDESLSIFLCEVETTINNRQLTTVSDDPNDLEPHFKPFASTKTAYLLPPGIFYLSDNCFKFDTIKRFSCLTFVRAYNCTLQKELLSDSH